jgi:hypothetical protein
MGIIAAPFGYLEENDIALFYVWYGLWLLLAGLQRVPVAALLTGLGWLLGRYDWSYWLGNRFVFRILDFTTTYHVPT